MTDKARRIHSPKWLVELYGGNTHTIAIDFNKIVKPLFDGDRFWAVVNSPNKTTGIYSIVPLVRKELKYFEDDIVYLPMDEVQLLQLLVAGLQDREKINTQKTNVKYLFDEYSLKKAIKLFSIAQVSKGQYFISKNPKLSFRCLFSHVTQQPVWVSNPYKDFYYFGMWCQRCRSNIDVDITLTRTNLLAELKLFLKLLEPLKLSNLEEMLPELRKIK